MVHKYSEELPWASISNYLLKTGNEREPKAFINKSIENIYELVPFEQARIFFLNVNGNIQDVCQIGADKQWTDAYLDYYSKVENGKYSVLKIKDNIADYKKNFDVGIKDWTSHYEDEFLKDYIKPQGISYSAGFTLHANDDFVRCVFALDRVGRCSFNKTEIGIMKAVYPHLENLFRNMHVMLSVHNENKVEELEGILSKREREIARLICEGLSPGQISDRFFISVSTIYRHIANIHLKLKVSSRQELILKLIRYGISPEI